MTKTPGTLKEYLNKFDIQNRESLDLLYFLRENHWAVTIWPKDKPLCVGVFWHQPTPSVRTESSCPLSHQIIRVGGRLYGRTWRRNDFSANQKNTGIVHRDIQNVPQIRDGHYCFFFFPTSPVIFIWESPPRAFITEIPVTKVFINKYAAKSIDKFMKSIKQNKDKKIFVRRCFCKENETLSLPPPTGPITPTPSRSVYPETPVTFRTFGPMWKTGTLSYEEFENELFDFLERARKVGDPWNLESTTVRLILGIFSWIGLLMSYQENIAWSKQSWLAFRFPRTPYKISRYIF